MQKVEISVKTAGGQTIVLSHGDRLVKEVTIECNSGRCASRHGQDKPTEVVIIDEKLPEAGEQWLSLILPEGSPQFEAMPKNFCGPQCVRDFLVYDYIAPGPRTVSVPKAEEFIDWNAKLSPPVEEAIANAQADNRLAGLPPVSEEALEIARNYASAQADGDPGDETN